MTTTTNKFSLKQAIDYIEGKYGKQISSIQYEDGTKRKFVVEFSDNVGKSIYIQM